MSELKPMEYKDTLDFEILCNSEYKDYKFKIVSEGFWPVASIVIPETNKLYGLDYDSLFFPILKTKGLILNAGEGCSSTYKCTTIYSEDYWTITIAYLGGYWYVDKIVRTKHYTTEEVLEDVYNVIDQLKEIDKIDGLKPRWLETFCSEIFNHYGKITQDYKAIEELSELIRAISRGDRENIVEEMADVYIMLIQMEQAYNIKMYELQEKMKSKLNRTLEIIRREK